MELRGPDDSGTWVDSKEQVYLGHQRLSILDLSEAGHQPMSTENSDHTIVFNGEVYNFSELKTKLTTNQFQQSGFTNTKNFYILVGIFTFDKFVCCFHNLRIETSTQTTV